MTALPPPSRRPRVRAGLWLGAAVLAALVLVALVPSLLAPHSPTEADPLRTLLPPGAHHPLGTDQNGRDVLSRMVHGARPSLLSGLGASGLALLGGTALGLLAARGGRVADQVVTRGLDVFMAIPGLLLALLVIAVAGPGTLNVVLAVAVLTMPVYARIVRAQILQISRSGYVEGAVTLGVRPAAIVWRHVLPNALGPVLVLATLGVGSAIGAGSTLSFLGLGPRPPAPEWGAMLADSRGYYAVAWWTAVFPGVAITGSVLAITVVGRHLQRRVEGRRVP
ncbi:MULTISPECIES: ABC transporter permease [Thermomonosporaceae]|uniref:ABC transporter permease n=1 Tax=Thermomonosporaceae TaxID=2012 RepID=UPI00255B30EF|nr:MULTISPECIES: ABC transporter permease [Thermomonosporaceae]MDL4771544.1 ABC transporter permease [Actinomadura xylanilytica]